MTVGVALDGEDPQRRAQIDPTDEGAQVPPRLGSRVVESRLHVVAREHDQVGFLAQRLAQRAFLVRAHAVGLDVGEMDDAQLAHGRRAGGQVDGVAHHLKVARLAVVGLDVHGQQDDGQGGEGQGRGGAAGATVQGDQGQAHEGPFAEEGLGQEPHRGEARGRGQRG